MTTRAKAFDCVEMKNRIQAERLVEYETHGDEFASYLDFINARVKDSELARIVRQKTGTIAAGPTRESDSQP